jgi:peptidoglycan-associated lipoprotein
MQLAALVSLSPLLVSLVAPSPERAAAARPAPVLVAQAAAPANTPPPSAGKPLDMTTVKVRFGFNLDRLEAEYRDQLASAAKCLKAQQGVKLTIAGHADERGTAEFNLALGERRALTVKSYLEGLGVPADRMRVVSYGEERPVVDGHDENAWTSNRRAEFTTEGTMQAGMAGCPDEGAVATTKVDEDEEARKRRLAEEEEARKRRLAEEEEARRRREEEEARRRAAADAAKAGQSTRMFPWLPIWVGPVVMALAIPPLLLTIPFVVSMAYLGWNSWSSASTCQEPLIMQNGQPTTNSGANLGNLCGTAWSAGQHPEHRTISVPAVAAGVGGVLVFAGLSLVTFAVGVGLLVAALLPASESADATAAQNAPSSAAPAPAPAPAPQQ